MATELKKQLLDILVEINLGKIATRYFGKSPSWLYHKFDGVDGNKKETDFTPEDVKSYAMVYMTSLIVFAVPPTA